MTHEKAIKILEDDFISNEVEEKEYNKAIQYAINQLKQCEVFDEPVEMEVSDDKEGWIKNNVEAIYKKSVIVKSHSKDEPDTYYSYRFWKPVKKKPLSRDKWYSKRMKGVNLSSNFIAWQEIENEYQSYKNQFNEK